MTELNEITRRWRGILRFLTLILTGLLVTGDSMAQTTTGYVQLGELKMYCETYGHPTDKTPLVLIHGGGSTIHTTFGTILPLLPNDREIIAVELQGRGHTADVDRPESFEQDADDVAGLVRHLKISQADFFGFSNGGQTALQIGIRHSDLVRKLVVASAAFRRDGFSPQLWEILRNATLENMPAPLKQDYLNTAPVPENLKTMFQKDRERMLHFKDWPDAEIRSIKCPTLVMVGDRDVVTVDHAVKMYHLLPEGRLVVRPGAHGEYIGEVTTAKSGSTLPQISASLVVNFLDESSANQVGR